MADNVRITEKANSTPVDGTTVATDEIGGVHYQVVKIDGGADGVSVPLVSDKSSGSMPSITFTHHQVHEGKAFEIKEVVDLSINNVRDIIITTPDTTKWGHFTFEFDTKVETEWFLYRNPVIVTTGTPHDIFNCNENSTGVADLVVSFIDNTSVANANLDTTVAAAVQRAHGISGAGRSAGGHDHEVEVILKRNEDYVLRWIATTAGYVDYHFTWYEQVNLA